MVTAVQCGLELVLLLFLTRVLVQCFLVTTCVDHLCGEGSSVLAVPPTHLSVESLMMPKTSQSD